jgi:hypothetical protein
LVRKPEKDCLEDIGLDEKIMLKWFLKKQDGRPWTEFIWLRIKIRGRLL